ncbi:MAG: hypothetical protein AAB971_04500, partial [Patescibacteria group bacterium]
LFNAGSTMPTTDEMWLVTKEAVEAKEQLEIDRLKAQEVQTIADNSSKYLLKLAHPDFANPVALYAHNLVMGSSSRYQGEDPVAGSPSFARRKYAMIHAEAFDTYAEKIEYWAGVLSDNPINDKFKEQNPTLTTITPEVMVGLEFEADYEKSRVNKLSDTIEDHFIDQQLAREAAADRSVLAGQANADNFIGGKKAKSEAKTILGEASQKFLEAGRGKDEAELAILIDGPVELLTNRHQTLTNVINAVRDGKKIKSTWIPLLSEYLGK